jgi:hypothetical protein
VPLDRFRDPSPGGDYEKSLKRLLKKYPKAEDDIEGELRSLLGVDTATLTRIPNMGDRFLAKVRVASTDMKKGKSGAFRVIIAERAAGEWVRVVAYAKSDVHRAPCQHSQR